MQERESSQALTLGSQKRPPGAPSPKLRKTISSNTDRADTLANAPAELEVVAASDEGREDD
jgi:hypothetical protein